MFLAPESGYQPSFQISRQINDPDWTGQEKQANGTYARIRFEMVAGGDHFFQLESFPNPPARAAWSSPANRD